MPGRVGAWLLGAGVAVATLFALLLSADTQAPVGRGTPAPAFELPLAGGGPSLDCRTIARQGRAAQFLGDLVQTVRRRDARDGAPVPRAGRQRFRTRCGFGGRRRIGRQRVCGSPRTLLSGPDGSDPKKLPLRTRRFGFPSRCWSDAMGSSWSDTSAPRNGMPTPIWTGSGGCWLDSAAG